MLQVGHWISCGLYLEMFVEKLGIHDTFRGIEVMYSQTIDRNHAILSAYTYRTKNLHSHLFLFDFRALQIVLT